jgi:hypothetical protein
MTKSSCGTVALYGLFIYFFFLADHRAILQMFITNDLFWTVVDLIDVIVTVMVRGFKVFYNRRYFLNLILAEVCKLKYSIKKMGGKIQALCMVFTLGEI